MKKLFILLVTAIACTQATPFSTQEIQEWKNFKRDYDKHYFERIEEEFRMQIFIENKKKIDKHNVKYEKGLVSFSMKINKHADLLNHEFVSMFNGINSTDPEIQKSLKSAGTTKFFKPIKYDLPVYVDWRRAGAVTPIKHQHDCSSCWAFSTTGSLEGQHFRKTGQLISLSEQNLVDCTSNYDNHGCRGGFMDRAFNYIKDNGGLDTEESYPYEGEDNVCRYNPYYSSVSQVTGYVTLNHGDERTLKYAVATIGPMSGVIDANKDSFRFYAGGVYYDPECTKNFTHGILIVGYGTESNGLDYWIVKNSWGSDWGAEGYFKIVRNYNNHCSIASYSLYPTV